MTGEQDPMEEDIVHIGFSTSQGLLSKIVRFFTRSSVSHVFLIIKVFGKPWILDATAKGVSLRSFSDFQKHNNIKTLIATKYLTHENIANMMSYLGQKYDLTGLVGGVIPAIGHWFKQKWQNPFNNPKASFCSEFVTQGLVDAGFPGAGALIPADTSPQDLLDFLINSPARIQEGS